MGAGRFSVDTVFGATDRMSGPMAKMESRATRFEKSLGGANKIADGGAAGMARLAMGAAVAGTAVGGVLTDIMSTGMQFEKTLLDAANKFEPGMEKSSAAFRKLSASAQEVGGATEFSSSQAASALNDLAGAGFGVDQAISALPKVVDLATASSLDLAAAGEIAAKSLGAFGLVADDPAVLAKNLQSVSDALMKSDALSSTNIPALFEAIKEGGPVAAQAGVGLNTFMAMAAGLGKAGIEGSVAGTTLKNAMLTLAAPTKEASAAFKKLKIDTKTATNELKNPIDLMGELQKATSKMTGAQRVGVLETIFGKIPLAGVSAMVGDVETLRKFKKEIDGSSGQIDLVAKSKRSGGTSSWDNFTSGIEATKLAIFDLVGGPLNNLINRTTDWIGANRQLIAAGFSTFINEAIPRVQLFAIGVQAAFSEFVKAKPILLGVGSALVGLFGGGSEGPRQQAFELGKTVADVAIKFAQFWLITKAITAATAIWNFVTGAAKAAMLLYEGAVIAVKWALVSYEMWSKAGTAATIAMNASSVIAAGNMIRMRAAAFAASGGVMALAKAGAAAAAAYAAWSLAADQNEALKKENAGLGIGDLMWGTITTGKGFATQVDEKMNREAKERAAIEEGRSKSGATSQGDLSNLSNLASLGNIDALTKQLEALDKASGQMPPAATAPTVDASGAPIMPGMPMAAPASKDPPVVSLKEDSSARLSQDLGAAVKGAVTGAITIKLKDPGKNVSSVEQEGSDIMSIDPSGSF